MFSISLSAADGGYPKAGIGTVSFIRSIGLIVWLPAKNVIQLYSVSSFGFGVLPPYKYIKVMSSQSLRKGRRTPELPRKNA